MTKRVLIPLPDNDFDPTEVAVPWRALREAGHDVVFTTERGRKPAADPILLEGVIFGKLGAEREVRALYQDLICSPEFEKPLVWTEIFPQQFDGLVLPGGHAQGMRQYLGSEMLQRQVARFWNLKRPVGAICHGVLVLARAKGDLNRSLLFERRTTCLPKYMERAAWLATFWKLGNYYRTYPAYVADEVKDALRDPEKQYVRGPTHLFKRGTATDHTDAFVVEDGNYLSARWPGDAYLFAERFVSKINQIKNEASASGEFSF